MDKLFLRELKIETIIGFLEWERRIKQTVSIDLEIGADSRAAARVDAEAGALNYESVAERLVEHVGASQYRLVETLAEAIARIVDPRVRRAVGQGHRWRSPARFPARATSAS